LTWRAAAATIPPGNGGGSCVSRPLQLVQRNGALFILLGLMVVVYFGRTVPAEFRRRALLDAEKHSEQELGRLRDEAERWGLQKQALETRDPTTLSRVVQTRWMQGSVGIDDSTRDH
jgi:hypothetical protein